jgi:hypothetical protein
VQVHDVEKITASTLVDPARELIGIRHPAVAARLLWVLPRTVSLYLTCPAFRPGRMAEDGQGK